MRRARFLVAIILSLVLVVEPVMAAAAPPSEFYIGNDIQFYDPNDCLVRANAQAPTVTTSVQGNDNAEKIYRFLTSTVFSGLANKSFTPIQAAGALGNFWQESGMNPAAIEGGAVDRAIGDGHGLAQWSYSIRGNVRVGPGRRGVLMDLATAQNKPWSDLELQLLMIFNEINEGYGGRLMAAGFDSAATPKEASYIFQKIYESAGVPNQANRDSAAESYYQKFLNLTPTTPAGQTTTATATNSCAATVPGTQNTSGINNTNVVFYLQCDPQWAKIPYGTTGRTTCTSGCAPTAMAMVITAMTGQRVTPADTVPYATEQGMYVTGVGSSWLVPAVLGPHWGLKASRIANSAEAITAAVKAGGMVVMAGMGGAPFTNSGHYIAIRGVTADGQWLIFDSNSLSNSQQPWPPQMVLMNSNERYDESGSYYVLTK